MSLGFAEFSGVLLGFTEFYGVLLGLSGLDRVFTFAPAAEETSPAADGFHRCPARSLKTESHGNCKKKTNNPDDPLIELQSKYKWDIIPIIK